MNEKRTLPKQKTMMQKYLLPITIISSLIVSGIVGYFTSIMTLKNSESDVAELIKMKKQVSIALDKSKQVIDTELPIIVSDLEMFNEEMANLVKNVEWLSANIAPISQTVAKLAPTINTVKKVSMFADFPVVGNIGTNITIAQSQLDEVNSLLFGLNNLVDTQNEMQKSYEKIRELAKKYEQEKSVDILLELERELNANLINQIYDLRNMSIETHKAYKLASSILSIINTTKSLFSSLSEMANNTVDALQFWKDNEEELALEDELDANLEKDIEASTEEMKQLPEQLEKRTKSTIDSITQLQIELQTIRMANMLGGLE